MNITQFAIEKKRISTVVLLIILVTGLLTYASMPRDEDPGFIIRTALITTYFAGASPERVEQLVTDKLEEAIQEMPEMESIVSQSKSGVSIIYVNVKESYREMRPIWDDLRRKVDNVRPELPSGVGGPFVNDDFGDVFGTLVAITAEGYTYAEIKEVADEVRNELLLIEEVAKVSIAGAQEERIFVEFNTTRLGELGLSPSQLAGILQSRNIIFPGGEVYTDDEQIVLEPSGNFESVEELQRTVIKLPGQDDLLQLRDVAQVHRGYVDPPHAMARFNGIPTLVLSVSLREGGNIISMGADVTTLVNRMKTLYPVGVEFDIIYFQPNYVDKKVNDFTGSLLQAVLIVILVMLGFLGLRTGLIVASLIPMAMVMAIMIMGFLDIGLDQMSLASLIIALGMLVDNAIVMAESIMVQIREGKPAVQAAIDSAAELRVPLLVSSLTTAAAFLPIFLAESSTGEYTAPLFKVVTITLLSSWVLSLTMTPLLCVAFLKVKKEPAKNSYDTRFYRQYRTSLITALRRPFLSLGIIVVIFLAVMQLAGFIPAIFFPANDKPVMAVEFELPLGSPITKTESTLSHIEHFIRDSLLAERDTEGDVVRHGFIDWATFVGSGAPKFALSYNPEPRSPEYAYMLINTTDRWRMESEFIPTLEGFCDERFPDLTTKMGPLPLGPPVDAPVQIRISGRDLDRVFTLADLARDKLASIPGAKNIRDNWGPRNKKLFVRINGARAQRAGLTNEDIAFSLQTMLSGIQTTDFREGDEVIPVVLRSVGADRKDIGKLESHNVFSRTTGRSVPLKQVADIEVMFQPSKVLRRNRLKTVTINADLLPGYNAIAIAQQVDQWLAEQSREWPVGYKYEIGGELESSGKAQASIGEKLPIAALIILLLLVVQFDSLRRPAIILLTIPLGLIGVVIGLFITQQPLGFMAFLGVISLAGIVINNAIVLLDRVKIEIAAGKPPTRAIIESAQRRLRPILLTTATTIGGLIPLWIGGGPLYESMAVAIIFGLLFATTLTLGVVPLLYALFFRVKFKGFVYEGAQK
jgi:multidrug efflux pump subunit AcrB